MKLITSTNELKEYCRYAASFDYVTIDTEFLRENTYFSQLCLIQLAVKDDNKDAAVVIDALSKGIDLLILKDLLLNDDILKVVHAGRQDLEIFFQLFGCLPRPLFDTQIAAMVCGFGDQIAYNNLVQNILNKTIDKSLRFTDWSIRPLSSQQLEYAINDVTFLREVYEFLQKKLHENNRSLWVAEEMEILTSVKTYQIDPNDAWKRIKIKSGSGETHAILKELASFRENYAKSKNIPRNRVLKDDAIIELSNLKPKNNDNLKKLRSYNFKSKPKEVNQGVLKAIKLGFECGPENYPERDKNQKNNQKNVALADLLRVLLKSNATKVGVAQRLIASTSDLDEIASGREVKKIFNGWRNDVFGRDVLRLCQGEIGLMVKDKKIITLEISKSENSEKQ